MLRLILPPNLASAALRDAIAVRVELNLTAAPAPGLLPALAILQRLGVPPQPVSLIQLKRAQLLDLVETLIGERVFFRTDRPTLSLAWNGLDLPGVTEHLLERPPEDGALGTNTGPAAAGNGARKPVAKPKAKKIKPEDEDHTTLTVDGSEHFLAITLPSRESMVYDAAVEFLRANRFALDPLTRKWWLRDRHKVLNILATHSALLRDNFHAEFTANFERNTAHLKPAEIATDIKEESDGYDVTLGLKAGAATDAQIRHAVAHELDDVVGPDEQDVQVEVLDPGDQAAVVLLEDEPGVVQQEQGRLDQSALVGDRQAQAVSHRSVPAG